MDGALGEAGASTRGGTHHDRTGSSALAPCGARRAAARALPRRCPVTGRPPPRPPSVSTRARPSSWRSSLEPSKIAVKGGAYGVVTRDALRALLTAILPVQYGAYRWDAQEWRRRHCRGGDQQLDP
jgi:hypothetical protein